MKFCVCFDIETGIIDKISNQIPDDMHYVEIDKDLYVQFVTDQLDYNSYLAVPNPKIKGKFDLIEKNKNTVEFDVDKSIHCIDIVDSTDKEDVFYIIQNKKDNKWQAKARLSSSYISFLNQTKDYYDNTKLVYVTKDNDPNVLLDVLHVKIKNFLEQDIFDVESKYNYANSDQQVSLYTGVVHETYAHVIEDDDEQ